MMNITRDNYEPFFLDYMEGNLAEDQIDQFLDFLEQNTDLKAELHQFENVHLPEEQIIFLEKMKLYKNAADEKALLENKVIAFLEGDLEDDERKSFEVYLASHPELQSEYNLFTKTRLVPESGIRFPDKQKLYRKSGTILVMNWVARAAAFVVLLWGINSLFQTGTQTESLKSTQEIAELSPRPELPVNKMESEKKNQGSVVQGKLKPGNESKPEKTKSIRVQNIVRLEEKQMANNEFTGRDSTAIAEISPILARLELEPAGNQLAVSHLANGIKINDQRNIMTIEEFLASRAKRVGNEGLHSAQRIARAGLGLASELSGDRIGYSVKDGKITSVGFESKLMAFSIPLKKNR